MNSKLLVFAGLAAAVVIGLVIWKSGSSATAAQPQGGGERPPAEVTVYTVKTESVIFTKELPGRTSAVRVAEIRPQVSGIIIKRLFKEGGSVSAGQQLYQIDSAPFQAAYDSAQAELMRAEASLQSAAPKAERYTELVKVGGVSSQEYDDAVTALAQAKASVAAAKAAVATAKINLDYTKVFSPISGHIGKSSVTEGALVTANQANALARVQQLDSIYVDVSQSAEAVMKLRRMVTEDGTLGSSAEVELLIGNKPYGHKGVMQFSDVTVDETTGMVQLRVLFPNPERELLPGLFVKASVGQAKDDAAILIPQQAAVRNADGSVIVWAVDAENTVNPRPVQVSDALGNKWLVSSGLQSGDRVVVEGLQKIAPGAKVNPVEQKAE
ncbi:efflux RND transporter periplasmic adaptor subunit [Geovibrio thiophilus]|uniref:Efflux RND transporter periplasmic adaptor subunit n=1 Tax=Geovibrio thiophilus TaxID=139438 RepID=A0A3R6AXB6_9BACT|nr:efflux RND transporter periplasmic adaptor subunit [Geovibrio thiophilus]QAR32618.1 efflux RND transporter periplasmic adaptor subunit [Geovibrio thiophilus]